jgi:hypothetical protein
MSDDETWEAEDISREDQRKWTAPVEWVAAAKSAAPCRMEWMVVDSATHLLLSHYMWSLSVTYLPLTLVSKHKKPVCQVAASHGFTRDGLPGRISTLEGILPGVHSQGFLGIAYLGKSAF